MTKKQKKKETKKEVNKKRTEDFAIEISRTQADVKSFLEKFKADVVRKRKEYQEYTQESRKKKKL